MDNGAYSGTFTFNWARIQNIKADTLYIEFMLQADGSSTIQANTVVYYDDGTTTSASTPRRSNGAVGYYALYPLEIQLDKNKKINRVVFKIYGNDYLYAGAQGYLRNVLLKRNRCIYITI